jgi:hypothetical protein
MIYVFFFFQQIFVLSILNMLHILCFSLQNAVYFIMLPFLGSCIIHILHTVAVAALLVVVWQTCQTVNNNCYCHDQQRFHHAPTVQPEAANAVVSS